VKSDILYVQILNAGKEEAAIREAIDSLGMIKTTPQASAADRVVAIDFKDSLIRAKLALKDGVVEYNAEASTGRELAAALRPFLQKAWLVKIVSSVRSADPSLTPEISINGQSSKNIAVRPVPEAKPALPVIYTGQKAVFSVKPSKDCYLTLVDVGTDGSMTILLPNNIQTQGSKLEADKVYQIPEPNASYEFVVEPPFGTEMVVAIATKDPIETKSILTESIPAKGGIKAVKDAMDGARLFRVTARTDSEEPAPPAPSPVVVSAAPSAGYATVSQPSDGLLPSDGFGIAFTLVEVKEAK
jgi:hypothetical protein